MKGYCPKCGDIVDEVEFTQFKGLCVNCYIKKLRKNFRNKTGDIIEN